MTRIETFSGSTLALSFTCKDENGDPFDLTGCTVRGIVRTTAAASVTTLDLNPTIPTPANGIVSVLIDDADTVDVAPGAYVFGVALTDPDGNVIPIGDGTIKFKPFTARPDAP